MQKNQQGLTRRSFLAGLAGAGALATAGLAGCAPRSASEASKESAASPESAGAASASGNPGWLGDEPAIDGVDETRETDLLIVGAGNGGMAAAA